MRVWAEPSAASEAGAGAGGFCVDEVEAVCVSGAAPVSSSMGASCEPHRTDEELESGGMDPETQLGAGLLSPETLGGVLV